MEMDHYKDEDNHGVQALLKASFGENHQIAITSELTLRLVVYAPDDRKRVVAHAAAYMREMSSGGRRFLGGIIGDVAVAIAYQRRGIAQKMSSYIHEHLKCQGANYSFLFAYNQSIYSSMGYQALSQPIHYFDVKDNRWNTYVYDGGMFFPLVDRQLNEKIYFNGLIY